MENRVRRVIIVAKDYEDVLTTFGNIATKTHRGDPGRIYEQVMEDLRGRGIQFLDLSFDLSETPEFMGVWYLRERVL